jgi:hypothetical protein
MISFRSQEEEDFSEAPSEFCVTASQVEMDEDEEIKSESAILEQDEETTQMDPSAVSRHQISFSSRAKPTKDDEDSVDSSIFTSGSNVESGGVAAAYGPVDPPAIIPESATRGEIVDGSVKSTDGVVNPATTFASKGQTLQLTEVDRVYLQLEDDEHE